MTVADLTDEKTMLAAIQTFLHKFCPKDRKEITFTIHKQMMKAHFYYVDEYDQGWYVLNDPTQFFEEPTDEEYWVYGTLWEKAVKYD